jgi:exodeoxyribonuclease VII small subunit
MKKNLSFEEAMDRLEEIIKLLEDGELDLDKALEVFEEGIKVYRYCTKKLEDMEGRVKVIMQQQGGVVEKFDLELEGD